MRRFEEGKYWHEEDITGAAAVGSISCSCCTAGSLISMRIGGGAWPRPRPLSFKLWLLVARTGGILTEWRLTSTTCNLTFTLSYTYVSVLPHCMTPPRLQCCFLVWRIWWCAAWSDVTEWCVGSCSHCHGTVPNAILDTSWRWFRFDLQKSVIGLFR